MANSAFSALINLTGTPNQTTFTPGLYPVGAIANNPILPGTGGTTLPTGTTGQRAGAAGTVRYNSTLTQIEGTIDGINWSAIIGPQASSASIQVYISPTGSDVTGTGSQQFPFATYEHARIYAAALATINNQYCIRPIGIFNIVGNITLSPFVNIDGLDNETSKLIATGQVLLSVAFAATANSQCHIKSVGLEAAGNIALTFTAFQNSRVHFDDVDFGTTPSLNFIGSSLNVNAELIVIENCVTINAGIDISYTNIFAAITNCNINDITFINSSAITNNALILANFPGPTGNLIFRTTAAGSMLVIMQGVIQIGSTLTLDGTLMTVYIDASSYSVIPTFLNGATIANITPISLSDGINNTSFVPINYTPTGTAAYKAGSVTGNLAGIDAALGAVVPTGALNTVFIGQGIGTPSVYSTATYLPTTTINRILYSSANNVVNELATANQAVLTTGATGIPVLTALAADGQLIIGSTAGVPAAATLTQGAGIVITNGPNSITIAAAGAGFTWTDVTGATQALAVENGYVTNNGAGVAYTLPATALLGETIKIVGKLGLTTINQNANQQILISSSSSIVGVGGSVAGTNVGDCIELICITPGASTVWRADSVIGNWTVV